MNNLEIALCKIMGFSPEHKSLAISEAINKEKLIGTFMRINGKVGYVHSLLTSSNTIKADFGGLTDVPQPQEVPVDTLDVFLPETGIYEVDQGIGVGVLKTPMKQWKKSFSPSFYKVTTLDGKPRSDLVYQLNTARKVPFIFSMTGVIYAGISIKIGTYNFLSKEILLTDYTFYQDLLDWINKEKLDWILP